MDKSDLCDLATANFLTTRNEPAPCDVLLQDLVFQLVCFPVTEEGQTNMRGRKKSQGRLLCLGKTTVVHEFQRWFHGLQLLSMVSSCWTSSLVKEHLTFVEWLWLGQTEKPNRDHRFSQHLSIYRANYPALPTADLLKRAISQTASISSKPRKSHLLELPAASVRDQKIHGIICLQ